jgi:hypothetical protein
MRLEMEDFDPAKTEIVDRSDEWGDEHGSPLAGILIIGIVYSILAAIVSILLGAGFWMVLASYAAGGALAMVLAAIVVAINRRHASHVQTQYRQSHASQEV